MSSLTTDPNNPELNIPGENGQNRVYLVLSDEERKRGFVRPLRNSYKHKTCGAITRMGDALSETYAVNPKFYGATFCVGCGYHYPVAEFNWIEPLGTVGPEVGS